MNKKQWFSLLAILIITSMMLAACKPQATPAPTTEPPKATEAEAMPTEPEMPADAWADVDPSGQSVIFWHQHSRDREAALQEIVDEFNATNEWGITVEAEYQGGYNDIFNKMLAVLNTPDVPNLVVAYQNQAATYQLAEGLIDMSPLVNSEKWGLSEADQKDFFPGFFSQDVFPTYDNARLGFPPNRSMEVMYYNVEWLAELKESGKIDFDGPPTTPEQFKMAACAAVEQPFSKAVAEGSIGYELSIDASRFASWTFAFGGDIFDYNTSQYSYDNEAATQAMNFLQDLFNNGCATVVVERYGDQTDFGTGKLLFTVGSSSGLPFYQSAVDAGSQHQWSVAAIPHTTPEPVMNIYGASISIPASTPEGELAAWLFLKYYTSPEVQAKWAMVSNYFPVRESVAEGLSDYFNANPAYKTAFDMLKYGHFEPPVPGYDFVRDKVREAMAAIAEGEDIASTLASLNTESNEILATQLTSPLPTPVPTPTPEPTPEPIGTADNPIVWVLTPSQDTEKVLSGAEPIAAYVEEQTGIVITPIIPTDYTAQQEALCSGEAQMAALNTFGYVRANERGCADAALASMRFGSTSYAGQIITRADSGIEKIEDLAGKTFCRPDPESTSGWIIPSLLLRAAGIDPETDIEIVDTGGHDAVVISVYNGDCDAGASFEDARSLVEGDFADVMEKVVVIQVSSPIPNDNISFRPDFPSDLREQIVNSLLTLNDSDAGVEILKGLFSWSGLEAITDAFYDGFRQQLEAAGMSIEDLSE